MPVNTNAVQVAWFTATCIVSPMCSTFVDINCISVTPENKGVQCVISVYFVNLILNRTVSVTALRI